MKFTGFLGALIILLVQPVVLQGATGIKHFGTPLIRQYHLSDFKAGRQTWMIEQGWNGMMYFGNNDGLPEFDGNVWNVYPLPNRTIIRCIKSDGHSRIYAGSFNEFGYFYADDKGRMVYQSLAYLVPEDKKDFGEVWKIHLTPFGVTFQSFSRIFMLRDNEVEIIEAPSQFHFSFYVKGELYLVDRQQGLMRLALDKLFPVFGMEILRGKEVWGMLPLDDKLLVATSGEGIYMYDGSNLVTWSKNSPDLLCESRVYCMTPLGPGYIAFGTIQGGLVIKDLQGNIIHSINRDQRLQNNTVLSMNTDDYENL